jgi:hypothetical protein
MKIRPVGVELFHADGRTDRHDEARSRYFKFCERAWKGRSSLLVVSLMLVLHAAWGQTDVTKCTTAKRNTTVATAAKFPATQLHLVYWKRNTILQNVSSHMKKEEATRTYHPMTCNRTFRCIDYTTSIIKKLFNEKFTCAQSKCKAIIMNIL